MGFLLISANSVYDFNFFYKMRVFMTKKLHFNESVVSFGGHIFYFILLSMVTYMLFNIVITILLLSLYMEFFDWIHDKLKPKNYFFTLNS